MQRSSRSTTSATRRRAGLLVVAAAFACVAGTVVAAAPAGAQADPPPGQPAVQSWALAPSGDDPSQPGARTDLSYELQPGATVDDSVTLFNYGNVQLTFRVYATDAYNTPTGQFELLAGDKPPTDVGTWVTLPQSSVTVPASSSLAIPIKITVPQNASPGDHAGAILASSQVAGADGQSHTIAVDRRTGSRLYLRVAGPLNPALVVEGVKASYGGGALNPLSGKVHVTYTVRNAGNVRLAARQKLSIRGLGVVGIKQRSLADLPELLPGNAITLTADLTHVAAALRLTVDVGITPFAGSSGVLGNAVTHHATTSTWAVPWSVLGVALIVAAWRWSRAGAKRRRAGRRGRRAAKQAPREPVPV